MRNTQNVVFEKNTPMNRAKGNKGEDIAVKYIEQIGGEVIYRNYYIRGGEVDIIFCDADVTVFCEVKMRSRTDFGTPCEAVNFQKQKRICKAALSYASKNKRVDDNYRFDIIEIFGGKVNHIKAAFEFIEPAIF